jgi:hypothetical protein
MTNYQTLLVKEFLFMATSETERQGNIMISMTWLWGREILVFMVCLKEGVMNQEP